MAASLYPVIKRLKKTGKAGKVLSQKGNGKRILTSSNSYITPKNGGLIIELPTRKKDIFEIFQDKKETIRRFISWSDLDLRQQEDLVKVFEFYNLVSGG